MKKWIPIILGTIGSFFILKSIFKLDKEQQKVIVLPVIEERVEKAIIIEKVTKTPAPSPSDVDLDGPYLESGKVNINSKR